MIEFRKTTDFPRDTLYNQLVDAYSFNADCQKTSACLSLPYLLMTTRAFLM